MNRIPVDQRPRERLIALGEEVLSDQELVALLLGCSGDVNRDVLTLAGELSMAFGGLLGLENAEIEELIEMKGVGKAKACRIKAAFELGRRSVVKEVKTGGQLNDPEEVARWFRIKLGRLSKEVFWALGLDTKNRVIRSIRIAEGHLSGVEVHPREVFKPLLSMGAASTILIHNHPSGDPEPSFADKELTQRLATVGKLVGIIVLDHVVVGREGFVSLAERGVLKRG